MNATRIIKVWSRSHGARALVAAKAAPTPVPGLMVNEDPVVRDCWNLTHLASGCALASGLDSPEQALDLAIKLGPVCDWTLPAADLLAQIPVIKGRWLRVLGEAGALEARPSGRMHRDWITAMEPLT